MGRRKKISQKEYKIIIFTIMCMFFLPIVICYYLIIGISKIITSTSAINAPKQQISSTLVVDIPKQKRNTTTTTDIATSKKNTTTTITTTTTTFYDPKKSYIYQEIPYNNKNISLYDKYIQRKNEHLK